MKVKVSPLVFYWASLVGLTLIIVGLVWWAQYDSFKTVLFVSMDLSSIVLRWLAVGAAILFARWLLVDLIADGTAKGIAKAKVQEIKQLEKESAKAAKP